MKGSSEPGAFSKKTFETFALRLVTQFISILTGIAIARLLGPAGKGVFAYATTVLALLVTLSGGASAAVSRQYGRLKKPSGAVYAGMLRFFFFICFPIAAALAVFALASHQYVLLAPAIAFPFAYINQVTLAFSLADGNVRWSNIQGLLIAGALAVAATIVCWVFHEGIGALLIAWVSIYGLVSIYSFIRVRAYAQNFGDAQIRHEIFLDQVRFGANVILNQLLASLNYQIDIFIVLALLGHVQLGLYSVAVGLGQTMWFLSRPLAVTSYGTVTSGTPRQAAHITVLCVRHALFGVGIASVFLFFLGPWLIELVYGTAFHASGRALQWLLPGILAYCVVPFFSQYFTLQLGKPGINTAVTALSIAICAVVTFALAPRIGIVAGSIGTSLSYVVSLIVAVVIFQRHTGVSLAEFVAFDGEDVRRYASLVRWLVRAVSRA